MASSNPVRDSGREVRIRLTTRCNYRCFFCHEEGGSVRAPDPTFAEIQPILEGLCDAGRRDFTLTGGEPLLNKATVLDALAWFARHPARPRVTLVTNGSLMDDAVLEAIRSCHGCGVHLSLHAADAASYASITGQRRSTPQDLVPRFCRLSAAGHPLKVNAVLVPEVVQDPCRFDGLVEFCLRTGASHLKLIELLVPGNHPELRPYHVPVTSCDQLLAGRAVLVETTQRTRTHRLDGSGLLVEVTRCACSLGCALCEQFGADCFTGGDTYHPCFLSGRTTHVTPSTLAQVLQDGRNIVAHMAQLPCCLLAS